MSLYSPIAYFISMIVLVSILFVGTSFFAPSFFEKNNSVGNQSRTVTIDGLRGYLATAVFFHHALIYHYYLLTGIWTSPPSDFFTQLGETGVSLFFMITGFLFFQKAIKSGGSIRWKSYFISRVFRIAPVYFLAIALLLLAIFTRSHWHLLVSEGTLLKQLSSFLSLGIVNIVTINGYANPLQIMAGVTWTLHYEWMFYLLLFPVACLLIRKVKDYFWVAFIGFLFLISMVYFKHKSSLSTDAFTEFFAGMLAASIKEGFSSVQKKIEQFDFFASIVVCSLLFIIFFYADTAFAAFPILINTLVFILISSGCSIFGLLKAQVSRQLGEVSYGVYLLHGLFLAGVFCMLSVRNFALHSIFQYWTVVTITGLCVLISAFLVHFLIEKPGMNLGRRIIIRGEKKL